MLSITGISGWMTACLPPTPRTVSEPIGELVADVNGPSTAAQLCRRLRVGVQRRLRVGVQQRGQPLGVGVIGMLMGDQDRVQAGDALEAVREVSRIEQHRGRGGIVLEIGE